MSDKLSNHLPEIIELWAGGATLEEIGNRFGRTRERVRQVLKLNGAPTREQRTVARLGERKCAVEGCTSTMPVRLCRELDKWLCVPHRQRHARGEVMDAPLRVREAAGNCACGKLCGPGTGVPRVRGLCPRCYSNWAYHNLDGRKALVKESTRKWRLDKYRNDEVWREKMKAYRKQWREGRKAAAATAQLEE